MRRLVITAALLTVVGAAWAAPANPATATPNDPLYQSVRRLALLAGQSPPSAVSPISYGELEAVLRRMDVDRLAPEQQDQYRAALRRVVAGASTVPGGTIAIESTLEGYFHSADDVDEWLYWYPDRRSLLSIPVRVSPVAGFGISMDLDWRQNYPIFPGYEGIYETITPDPLSNVFADLRETDVQFPFHALLTAAGSGWSMQFGRSRIGWGLGHTGSLLLSDHVEYHDFLMASVFGRLISYRALYLDLEPWLNAGGTDPDRVYLAHRIEFRPSPWLTFAANEALIFHGKAIELRYLNPLMILHNWFIPQYGNSMINLELSVRPLRGLEVWAHLAVDQVQSALEKERSYTDSEPEAFGYLAGVEYAMPISDSWLTIGTEWAYLDPWMYIGRSIMGSLTYRRRVQAENVLPAGAKVIVEKSLGYPSGPDYYGVTGFAKLDLRTDFGTDLVLSLDMSFFANGENEVGRSLPPDDADDAARVTPSGPAPEFVTAARLTADATFLETELWGVPIELSGGALLDVVRILNNDHVSDALLWDVQFSPYISVSTIFGK
ncbi:MAG: capsule assembly Wzi family protein [Spirochaetia bacterium]